VFFGLAIPWSAWLADRFDPRSVLMAAAAALVAFGFVFAPLLQGGSTVSVFACLALGLLLIGMTYGPLGAALGALFPTPVRYTGASFAFNFAGILGASLTPTIAKWLSDQHGLASVGWYLSIASGVSLVALLLLSRSALAARH
jgi:MFS family permease